ncbi:CD276 antigen-like [Pristis pectinata]|uniref:CD276 antigen-like n=1 Tax=Pristis pectinata TaxID=685728 RepID=UPI00223CD950|nr:CD276 antigen-like [Pristis pectinata]XP_051892421.1 CD276 antigen-like [Pristis pectinata]
MKYFLGFLVGIGFSLASVEFKVCTPEAPVTAVYGQYTVLTCSFPVQVEIPLEKLVINWQRVEKEEVVYSYYYGKEQPSHQSPRYSGRTSLFPEDFKNGNASLKLDWVRAEDVGQYLCFVGGLKGSGQGIVSLTFAAYYKEPNLLIKLIPSGMMFTFESRGYPAATVSWYNKERENISSLSETLYQQDGDGLYLLQSILKVSGANKSSSYTFLLRNDVLHQSISRTFDLSIETKADDISKRNKWMLALSLLTTEFGIILILAKALWRKEVSQQELEL